MPADTLNLALLFFYGNIHISMEAASAAILNVFFIPFRYAARNHTYTNTYTLYMAVGSSRT